MTTHLLALPPRAWRQRLPLFGTLGLALLALLAGCATQVPAQNGMGATGMDHRAPGHYAQSADSATSGCLRNPACYTTAPGEEAILPWVSRTASAVDTATTVAMVLKDADIKIVERVLTDCAKAATEKVNAEDKELQGQEPDWEECRKVVRKEGNKDVTRAMELGARKHEMALECARQAFAELYAHNVSVEPTYQQDFSTGRWLRIDPEKVAEWLQLGLKSQLWGALVPDIVLHASGNPNQVHRVYDFKFPCPSDKGPKWGQYAPGQPHYPKAQGEMYEKALLRGKDKPRFVTPDGVKQ